MATFMNKEEELQSKVETLEHRIEQLERALKNMSEQDSNCNLPHVMRSFIKGNLKIEPVVTFNRVTIKVYLCGEEIGDLWDTIN